MVICKYTKTGRAVYTPHLDLLRTLGMAARRTDLKINYSEGFNPHLRIFLSQPMPIGTASICEYMCVDTPEDPQKFMQALNTSLPDGVQILKSVYSPINLGVAALTARAEYSCDLPHNLPKNTDFSTLLGNDEILISYTQKGVIVTKDVKPLIYSLSNTHNQISMMVAAGNTNLRADRLIAHLLSSVGQSGTPLITKTAVFDNLGNNLDTILLKGAV